MDLHRGFAVRNGAGFQRSVLDVGVNSTQRNWSEPLRKMSDSFPNDFLTTLASHGSLFSIGDGKTPSAFNRRLNITPPAPSGIPANITTLWAWDNAFANWYFYAPSLENAGNLASQITGKNYLDFSSQILSPNTAFWVKKP